MGSNRTVILDCGASRTALGVFRRKGERLCLEQFAAKTFPLSAGPDDHWLENTCAAFQSLRDRINAAKGPVVLVLPAHAVLTKLVKTPRVALAQREKIIRFEAEQNIPYALADVVWDSLVVHESDREMEGLLATAKVDLVEPLCVAAQDAGFQPELVLPGLLGTLAGFRLAQPDLKGSSLVLHLGTRSATLLLVEPDHFAGRSFALGNSNGIRSTSEARETETTVAGMGSNVEHSPNLLTEATEDLKTRLLQEITRTVLHLRGQSRIGNPEHVYLTGEGAHLPGLGEVLAAKLKIPVGRLDLRRILEVAKDAARDDAAEQAHSLTELVGAAATQLRSGQPVLNLLPLPRRQQTRLRQRQPWLIAAAVLAAAALLPPLIHSHRVKHAAQEKLAGIERAIAPWREREARNRDKLQQLGEVRQQIAGLQSVYERRAAWPGLLVDLQDRLLRVEDVWLEKLQVAPASTDGPLRLLVSGRMLDRANPLSKVSPETFGRVKTLLASVAESPFVGAVETARFDNSQPGILKFDFVLVTNPQRPL